MPKVRSSAFRESRGPCIPHLLTEYGEIQASTVSLMFTRAVSDGIVEDFEIRNYGTKRARFNFEIALRTDFADIFEVKSKEVIRKGHVTTGWSLDNRELISRYEHEGFTRSLVSRVVESFADSFTPEQQVTPGIPHFISSPLGSEPGLIPR
jgi:hypothetical protein